MAKRSWSELTPRQRRLIVAGAAVQITLQGLALRDLRRRPADDVNGPKWAWAAATFLNTVGPVGYFVFGRRQPERL